MSRLRRCRACKRSKPLAAFLRNAAHKDARDVWCRDCRRAYARRWRAANREACRERQKAYYRKNRARLRAYNRAYQRRRRKLIRTGKWQGRGAVAATRARTRAAPPRRAAAS